MSRKIPEVFLVLCAFLTGALALTEIGLAIKAFQILNQRKKLVTSQLPGGKLSAEPILQVGIAMIAVSSIALGASIFASIIRFTHRSKRWISVSFGVAAFVCLPALIAETVIGSSGHSVVTASLPQIIVDQLVAVSGISLYYHDNDVVIGRIVVGWFLFTSLVLASFLERKKFTQENQVQSSVLISPEKSACNNKEESS